jgi:indoleamine 2,3-dioxygenase
MQIETTLIENLADYEVDPVRGFLPSIDPLKRLPAQFDAWEHIASELSALIMTRRLRTAIDSLHVIDTARLEGGRQRRRALLLLSVFANAYVWAESPPATRIPRGLAIPWIAGIV